MPYVVFTFSHMHILFLPSQYEHNFMNLKFNRWRVCVLRQRYSVGHKKVIKVVVPSNDLEVLYLLNKARMTIAIDYAHSLESSQ